MLLKMTKEKSRKKSKTSKNSISPSTTVAKTIHYNRRGRKASVLPSDGVSDQHRPHPPPVTPPDQPRRQRQFLCGMFAAPVPFHHSRFSQIVLQTHLSYTMRNREQSQKNVRTGYIHYAGEHIKTREEETRLCPSNLVVI